MWRILRPQKLLLIYLMLFIVTVLWLHHNIESFCPNDAHDKQVYVSPYEGAFQLPDEHCNNLTAFEKQLKFIEQQLRRQFPEQVRDIMKRFAHLPTIFAITPTYARSVQKAELTRLMNTFINVLNFHWIVVEDANSKSRLVSELLKKSGVQYTHLNEATPSEYKMQPKDPNWLKPRGVLQRNKGLSWIRDNIDPELVEGVVYFADDDNTYDLQLFEEMRFTRKVSVWPVGLVGYLRYERPIVSNHKVVGWFTYWKPDRSFATDMAGFAINMKLFFDHPEAQFSNLVKRGELESELLSKLQIHLFDLEPRANECEEVLVWHTRTEKPSLKNEDKLRAAGRKASDPTVEV